MAATLLNTVDCSSLRQNSLQCFKSIVPFLQVHGQPICQGLKQSNQRLGNRPLESAV